MDAAGLRPLRNPPPADRARPRWPPADRGRRAGLAIAALFCWRVGASPVETLHADGDALAVTVGSGLDRVDDMVVVPGHGAGAPDIVGGTAVTAGGTALRYDLDFVIFGAPDALRIVPLRSLPPEPTTFRFAAGTSVDPNRAATLVRQTLTWGLPPWAGGTAPAESPRSAPDLATVTPGVRQPPS